MTSILLRRPRLFQAVVLGLVALALQSGCATSKTKRKRAEAPPPAAAASPDADKPLEKVASVPGAEAVEPTVVSLPTYRDPLIKVNRAIFAFNDVTYRFLLVPLAKGYRFIVPKPARTSVGNFFHNLKTPIYVANDILQLKPTPFGQHLARFLINSTLGLGGLFDPAQAWFKLKKTKTDFEDTLARYGVGYGVYLVLPIIGSSDLRDGLGLVGDYFLNPVPYLIGEPESTAVRTFDSFQEVSPSLEKYGTLRRETKDRYIFFRNLYLQGVQRDAEKR